MAGSDDTVVGQAEMVVRRAAPVRNGASVEFLSLMLFDIAGI